MPLLENHLFAGQVNVQFLKPVYSTVFETRPPHPASLMQYKSSVYKAFCLDFFKFIFFINPSKPLYFRVSFCNSIE